MKGPPGQMRFLLINQFYAPDVAPTGAMLHDLAQTLVARGHHVDVLCSSRSYDGGSRWPSGKLDGVNVHRLPALGFGRRSFVGKCADYMTFLGLLSARLLAHRPRPDVILALTTPPWVGLLSALAARLRRCLHAHWVMDLYPDVLAAHHIAHHKGLLFRTLAALTRRELEGASLVLALGPAMARHVEAYTPKCEWVALWGDPSVLPWPDDQPNTVRAERGWTPEELVLMYSGNMGLGHRFTEFLDASRTLGPQGPVWAFSGGGKRRVEVETFAKGNPEARIQLFPYVPRERLRESLGAADVHLASLDSSWQGLMVPSKLQGIFAAGRPVIFVGGEDNELCHWIHESGGGWCVREGHVKALLEAVEEAKDGNARRAKGRLAWEYARDKFMRGANCERISDLLEAGHMKRATRSA